MKNRFLLAGVLSAFALTGVASAQTASGTLGVTATVAGSISLTFITDVAGVALTNSGTSAATVPFGTVSMSGGSVPAHVTKTVNGTTSFTLSTPFDVLVTLANSASTTYTLTATLATADLTNTWLIGAIDMSAGAAHALTAAGEFGAVVPYTLNLTVPASEVAGTITNSIGFSAVGG
jgi:hypothetical protein